MKIEFIKRGAATRLILIFAGWSTDARYYSDCTADGWDTAVVSDYRDLTMPPIPGQYATVYIFAYSLGVAAATVCAFPATVRIAICGSPEPVSDLFGIPEAIYEGTLEGLSEKSLAKFHLRMSGDRCRYAEISGRLPLSPDIEALKEELAIIRKESSSGSSERYLRFDRVYLAEEDRIFPFSSLQSFWNRHKDTTLVTVNAPHAVDISSIIKDCLPDTISIGEGFQRACSTYNENATIQREICNRMMEVLNSVLPAEKRVGGSLLEIGPGQGLLTKEWRKILHPKSAFYVDLAEIPGFGIAEEETYLQTDAEEWLKATSERFDVILSASTIQWFADPIRFVSTVRKHLNPGGMAILSTFVKGNLHELDAVRPSPIIYRPAEEYADSPAEIIAEWKRTLRFQTTREMMKHLSHTGVSPRRRIKLSARTADGNTDPCKPKSSLPLELTFCPLILLIGADYSLPFD